MMRAVIRFIRRVLCLGGLFLLLAGYLATTRFPWNWYGAMAQPGPNAPGVPDMIVMMGGGGIPSESGLMRSWKTAEAARLFTNALVVVAMPVETSETTSHGVEHELQMRGVSGERLRREPRGRNTREQAVEIHRMLATNGVADVTLGLVTSPEHMKRTWLSFRKAGFERLVALPSWPEEIKADLSYHEAELGVKSLGGAVGGNDMIKYKFWDNLGLMLRCTRESIAIWYYRWMGWV